MKRAWIAAAAFLAWASPARADVQLNAPAECPSARDRLQTRVSELAPQTAIDADVTIERQGASLRARITLRAPSTGERALEAGDCAALIEATALVIAMSTRIPEPPPTPTPTPTPTSTSTSTSTSREPQPPPQTSTPTSTSIEIGVHGAIDFGSLSSAAVGGGFLAGVAIDRVRVELEGDAFGSQRIEITSEPATAVEPAPVSTGAGADLSLLSGTLRGCVDAITTPVAVAPCVGVAAEKLSGTGFGASKTTSDSQIVAGPSVALRTSVPLGARFALRAAAEAVLPTARRTFVIGNVGPVHRPAGVIAHLVFGPEVRF